ncbi:MAG: nucleotidyltransferase domain-containing protein [Sporomusaceae bacterium]|jgi:predicted nucleotidyltransferase|nr:nucleotidyltransferase domain-containing protein [Sporomusaceae bacterium]
MPDIRSKILRKLAETQACYGVKILLAIESGSRGWGFASPDSDYDCRFIYAHPRDWYLTVFEKKDIIEYAVDPVFDVNGWDIKKVLQHIIKSNAVMFEWLSSNEVYLKDETITGLLQSLAADFFNPIAVSYHYLSIAKKKLADILAEDTAKLKQYFYILRPIANLNFIQQHGKMPYMEYDRTLSETEAPPEIRSAVQELMAVKVISNEGCKIKQHEQLITYFKLEIDNFTERLHNIKFQKNQDRERIDLVFKKIIEWAQANECE